VASYELDIKAAFEARAGGGSVSGVIRIPYLAEENHDEVGWGAPGGQLT
jgi:hypothetical protein